MSARIVLSFGLILAGSLALVGCQPPPPPEPEAPPPPPPPSAEQIHSEMRQVAEPLLRFSRTRRGITAEEGREAIAALQGKVQQYGTTENGPRGVALMRRDLEREIPPVRNAKRWLLIRTLVDAVKALDPDSVTYDDLRARAQTMLSLPACCVRGFFEVDDELFVFVEVRDLEAGGQITQYRIREGEEFHGGLKLARINENRSGCVFEVVELGETFGVRLLEEDPDCVPLFDNTF